MIALGACSQDGEFFFFHLYIGVAAGRRLLFVEAQFGSQGSPHQIYRRKLALALVYLCHSSSHQTSVLIRRSFRALTATPLQAALRAEFLFVPLERK